MLTLPQSYSLSLVPVPSLYLAPQSWRWLQVCPIPDWLPYPVLYSNLFSVTLLQWLLSPGSNVPRTFPVPAEEGKTPSNLYPPDSAPFPCFSLFTTIQHTELMCWISLQPSFRTYVQEALLWTCLGFFFLSFLLFP